MKAFIFTEALSTTGLGHLGRCTALAEILIEHDVDATIVLHKDDSIPNSSFSTSKVLVCNWKDFDVLNSFLLSHAMEIAYVDSYLADPLIYETIASSVQRLVCIDDNNRISYPNGSIILNPGFGGKFLNYDLKRNCVYTGIEFVLLRKPFRENFAFPKVNEEIRSILVTMGGTDSLNLVPRILEVLTKNFPNVRKEIVIGPAFDNIQLIEKSADNQTKLHRGLDAISMRNLMQSVDLAITAGGQTTYELAKTGTPMVVIETIENQEGNVAGFLEMGIDSVIRLDALSKLETLLRGYLFTLADSQKRLEFCKLLTPFKNRETDFLFI
ncbi:PseG/SpsG family protein [Leptospira bandrabouensis]|uniref:PseG/SpsG family protein n=1 Tax=Leptospira bandrabouensis TaxID=2484903 RepID=UPI001EE8A4D1|nr:UDP-2,4-diacetamido-2,4,6-trideoxy-beta-L-altropyranose hydrolase [Leptospira bandrabouensis]MCG6144970.1 UDP-2,4-diacetamido-2,4,6-trideoxy-beta-L-altropyranose hydrolase [Leptospira bandrabouensis]MCG6160393.1 UDP-2,4-diacetamido-2,4,6-trideoxy-beta-L-altropyranose hydrolase [Leptospira bandrabouensis]MCG6164325.1 UDP-2,4-diacetamido-2,4,6-trideoxy-beta-L-altropyranose hydrolase [Leptospira bandrabouensis]